MTGVPDVPVTVREIVPGALVAAIGWTALQALFQVYVSMASMNVVLSGRYRPLDDDLD